MGKIRNLNGLPNSLVESYFSTLGYYHKGYMADRVYYAAREKNLLNLEINILKETVFPERLNIKALSYRLNSLKDTIEKTLVAK